MPVGTCVVCGQEIRVTARSSSTPMHRECRAEQRRRAHEHEPAPAQESARLRHLRTTLQGIQESIDASPPDKRAPLYGQLLACEARIAALADDDAKGAVSDPIDEIAARRAKRGGATSRLGQASGRPV